MGIKLMKKVILFALVCIMLLVPAALAEDAISMGVVGAREYMPIITAYVSLYDENNIKVSDIEADSISATLDGVPVNTIDIQNFKDTNEGSATIFLVDISKSLSTKNFDVIKDNMMAWVEQMTGNDAVSIITFGADVTIIRDYTNDKEQLEADIESLELTDNTTSFYEAVQTALTISSVENENIPYLRQIIIITDGANVQKGSITKNELIKTIEQKPYVIYGIGAYGGSLTTSKQEALDILGEFARTSEGQYYQKKLYAFNEMFTLIKEDIDSTQVVTFDCGEMGADGNNHNLYIVYEKDDKKVDGEIDIRLEEEIPDTDVPEVIDFKVLSENELIVYFSESVSGADQKANYEIKDSIGQIVIPHEIIYSEMDDEFTASIKFLVDFDGQYTVKIKGIKDQAGNMLSVTSENFEVVIEEEISFFDEYKLFIFIAIGIILLAAAAAIIILMSRKKKEDARKKSFANSGQTASMPVNHSLPKNGLQSTIKKNTVQKTNIMKSKSSKSMHMVVIDNKNSVSEMDKTVQGSIVIGRSQECDVKFNDGEMSRQHCKITFENGQMYAEDLKATNTTIVNGIPLTARIRLNSGDSLLIGQTEIKVSWKED